MKVFINKVIPNLDFIKVLPNQWVVIKPNLVKESKETDTNEWESVIISPKLIRLVMEYYCRQLKATEKITICNSPQTDPSFKTT